MRASRDVKPSVSRCSQSEAVSSDTDSILPVSPRLAMATLCHGLDTQRLRRGEGDQGPNLDDMENNRGSRAVPARFLQTLAVGATLALLTLTAAPPALAVASGQVVKGAIAIATPQPLEDGACLSGAQRRVSLATGDASNGIVGWAFPVDPKTQKGHFSLKATGGSSDVDLNITFYKSLGDASPTSDPTAVPPNISYQNISPGGEKGTVPPGMTAAIVCTFQGTNASFTYTAIPPRS